MLADDAFAAAGLHWYEVSNWARDDAARCRHNLLYWTGGDWWGVGPGAHSHVGGVRWWNVKHPSAYAARIAAGESARPRRRGARRRGRGSWSGCCWRSGCATACPLDVLDDAGPLTSGRRELGVLEQDRRVVLTRRAACSPTQSSATWSLTELTEPTGTLAVLAASR